jgi:hypothetical protein
MKVIEFEPQLQNTKGMGGLTARMQTAIDQAFSSDPISKGQEIVVDHLARALNNQFHLLHNLPIKGLDTPAPLVLVGPPGIFLIYASAIKGMFLAKIDDWDEMKDSIKQYVPARPNLVQTTLTATETLESDLAERLNRKYPVQGVVILTNPGTYVETVRPAVRIILADGLGPFITSLLSGSMLLSPQEVSGIITAYSSAEEEVIEDKIRRDQFDYIDEPKPVNPKTNLTPQGPGKLETLSGKIRITTRQWVFIGVLLVFNIILLMGFILFLLFVN